MKTKISNKSKIELVKRHINGESVGSISKDTNLPKSTIYYWINQYSKNIEAKKEVPASTVLELDHARKRIKKLEGLIEVMRAVDCTASAPLRQKLEALESLYGQYSVHTLCEALDVSRGAFYNHILRNKRNEAWFVKRRENLKELIRSIYDESNQIFGAGKVKAVLNSKGYIASKKFVSELMREMGLYSISISSKKDNVTLGWNERKSNILKRNFDVDQPNKVWVSDVTCYKFKENYYYICVFIDLFSRKIISISIGRNNSTQLVKTAFNSAYLSRKPPKGLIIHTDRGTPYTSFSMHSLVQKYGITQSFSNAGKPHDNAVVESFFSYLKKEELYRRKYNSESEFKKLLNEYVKRYNSARPHKYLKYKTPEQFEVAFWKIPNSIR